MQAMVSVVIPVYNTKEYLVECVGSVCAQHYPNIEIVLVDDGSTDGSGALCDTLAAAHSTAKHPIVVLHKENGGLADARNYGILHATGAYLLFLDSDDYYLSNDAVGTLMEKAAQTNSDILCFNYTRSKSLAPERSYRDAFSADIADLITSNVYTSSACLKLIKKEVLTTNQIDFVKGQQSEDILFSGRLLLDTTRTISFVNEVFYYYRVRETSLTNTLKLKNIVDTVDILHSLERYGDVSSTQPLQTTTDRQNILAYTAFQYATLLINIHLCAEEIPAALLAEIYAMRYLLQYNPKGIVRVIYLCTKCVGIRGTSRLMSLAFKGKQVLAR